MLATLARTALSLVVLLCAALVALAVLILRALDARGFDRAGAMLSAMGARRVPRAVRVEVQRAPVSRRRVRALARHAGAVFGVEEPAGWDECAACDGTGEGTYGRSCSRCAGRGDVKVRTERDLDAEEARGWRIALAGG